MSDEAKVGLADEASDVSSEQKDRVKGRERFYKNLGTRQRKQRCLQWLFCWVRYRWIVQLIGIHRNIILSMHICSAALSFVCFRRPDTLAFVSFFVFLILPNQLQEKPSALSALRNTRFFWRVTGKFPRELMVVNFPSADWLSDLRTQLKAFVGGVCLRSKRFFLALFSRIIFFAWSRHFKEIQLKRNLFVCPQIWTVARLTYKNQKRVCELFISKYFFSESDFCTITSHFLNPISKCSVTFYCN